MDTLLEEINCVKREIALRETVYPREVARGRMTEAKAERELNLMRRVLARLQAMQQPTLFVEDELR